MAYYCYILFSKVLDRYYIGSTNLPIKERLKQHNSAYYGAKKFTAKSKDWEIYHFLMCESRIHAEAVEFHIKKMKSRKYIENLKRYSEMSDNLIQRFY